MCPSSRCLSRSCKLTYCLCASISIVVFFFFQAEDGIRDRDVTGVQTCALPIFIGVQSEDVAEALVAPDEFDMVLEHVPRDPGLDQHDADWTQDASVNVAHDRVTRSEERRVGKECRSRWSPEHEKKKDKEQESEQ